MDPVRTCLGCRQRASQSSLVRVVARDGRIVIDLAKRLPGRGAWIHADPKCIETAVRRNAFGRALRTNRSLDTSALTSLNPHPEEQVERHMDNS